MIIYSDYHVIFSFGPDFQRPALKQKKLASGDEGEFYAWKPRNPVNTAGSLSLSCQVSNKNLDMKI